MTSRFGTVPGALVNTSQQLLHQGTVTELNVPQLGTKTFFTQFADTKVSHQLNQDRRRRGISTTTERDDKTARVTLAQVIKESQRHDPCELLLLEVCHRTTLSHGCCDRAFPLR